MDASHWQNMLRSNLTHICVLLVQAQKGYQHLDACNALVTAFRVFFEYASVFLTLISFAVYSKQIREESSIVFYIVFDLLCSQHVTGWWGSENSLQWLSPESISCLDRDRCVPGSYHTVCTKERDNVILRSSIFLLGHSLVKDYYPSFCKWFLGACTNFFPQLEM